MLILVFYRELLSVSYETDLKSFDVQNRKDPSLVFKLHEPVNKHSPAIGILNTTPAVTSGYNSPCYITFYHLFMTIIGEDEMSFQRHIKVL